MWQLFKSNILLGVIIFIFIVAAGSLIFGSGIKICDQEMSCTYQISEWQMHDSLWHISLAKLSFRDFPFSNPFYSGTTLAGYNYFLDIVLYGISLLGISPFVGYYYFLPIAALFFYIYFCICYTNSKSRSTFEKYLTYLFLFFGGTGSYLANLYATGSLTGSVLRGFPVVTSLSPPSMLLNLPYAFSLSLLLYLITKLVYRPTDLTPFKTFFWFLLAFATKFYAGVAGLILLLVFAKRSNFVSRIFVSLGGTMLAYILFYYRPFGTFPFVFAPFALVHVIIDDIHLFYNHTLTLARYYLLENLNSFPTRLILLELYTLTLFFILNFGSKLVVILYYLFIHPKNLTTTKLLFVSIILSLVPVFFVQSGGWYNTMQFMYYAVFITSLIVPRILSQITKHNYFAGIIFGILIMLTLLPNTLEQFTYPFKSHNIITSEEYQALQVLKQQPKGIVHVNRPWAKRALIPAFSEKEMFYLDTDQLMLFLPEYQQRLALVKKYEGGSIAQIPADYYYIYKNEVGSPDSYQALKSNPNLTAIFDSPNIAIFAKPAR